jgi:hypothetical protein
VSSATLLIYTLAGVLKLAVPMSSLEACERAALHMSKQQTAHVIVCEGQKDGQ